MLREIIKVKDTNYEIHIPKEYINKEVEIIVLPYSDPELLKKKQKTEKAGLNFSNYNIRSFDDIDNPVEWQNEIRKDRIIF
jgi:hypothetical protein